MFIMNYRKETTMSRIAVFSDIHGNREALTSILNDIKKENIDKIIYLGDVIGIGPKPKECLEIILNSNIETVTGNHELYYTKGLEIDDEITKENEIKHHRWVHECIKDIHKDFEHIFEVSQLIDDKFKLSFGAKLVNALLAVFRTLF